MERAPVRSAQGLNRLDEVAHRHRLRHALFGQLVPHRKKRSVSPLSLQHLGEGHDGRASSSLGESLVQDRSHRTLGLGPLGELNDLGGGTLDRSGGDDLFGSGLFAGAHRGLGFDGLGFFVGQLVVMSRRRTVASYDPLDDDRLRCFLAPSSARAFPTLFFPLDRTDLSVPLGDPLLHRLSTLKDLFPVTLGKDGHDRVFLDDGVEQITERLDRDERLRLSQHGVEGSDRLARILGFAQSVVETVAQRLVVFIVAIGNEFPQPLHRAVRDAVAPVPRERRTHHQGAVLSVAPGRLPPRLAKGGRTTDDLPMRLRMRTLIFALVASAVAGICVPTAARAQPVRATGTAQVGRGTDPATVRRQAIERAQRDALTAALDQLGTPVDPEARQAVLKAVGAWTGSYRIVSEHTNGDTVAVELDVDVDLARLAKRVGPRSEARAVPMFVLGEVRVPEACASAQSLVGAELLALGALTQGNQGVPIDVSLECESLGPVRHTFVHAARVGIEARVAGDVLARARVHGFGADAPTAMTSGVQVAASAISADLSAHRRGEVVLRVEAPLPAARIRRLERSIEESVLGVRDVEVGGLDPDGAVLLRVRGDVRADRLASSLEGLSLPDFSLTIVEIDAADALTIRLR